MRFLVDTGILLRLVHPSDPQYLRVRSAIRALKARGDSLITSAQNIAEFWNVCTRPASARGGYGLTVLATERRLRLLDWIFGAVCPDHPFVYPEWKRLVVEYSVKGVQVHDARLVALMLVNGITHLLTLNPTDFRRYPSIIALTPDSVLQAGVDNDWVEGTPRVKG